MEAKTPGPVTPKTTHDYNKNMRLTEKEKIVLQNRISMYGPVKGRVRFKEWQKERAREKLSRSSDFFAIKIQNALKHAACAHISRENLKTIETLAKTYKFSASALTSKISQKAAENEFYADELLGTIIEASKKYKLDPSLIAAIIETESSFDPKAESWAGGIGFMQITKICAKQMKAPYDETIFKTRKNIKIGAAYLRYIVNTYDSFKGNWRLILAAYNKGPAEIYTKFKKHKNFAKMDIPKETRDYPEKVMQNYEYYRKEFARR